MERCFLEMSESIDVNTWVIDEPADDLYGGMHCCVVKRRPSALVSVVDIDGKLRDFLLKMVQELLRQILQDGLKKAFMHFLILSPALFPNRFSFPHYCIGWLNLRLPL